MAILTGNDGALSVGGTSVAALRNFSIEMTSDTIESTTMGKEVRTYLKGLSAWSGSADIYFDTTDLATTATFFPSVSGTTVGQSPVALKAYVKDDTTNDIAFTGTVIVTGYTVNSAMDGMVEASVSFQGSGPINFSSVGSA